MFLSCALFGLFFHAKQYLGSSFCTHVCPSLMPATISTGCAGKSTLFPIHSETLLIFYICVKCAVTDAMIFFVQLPDCTVLSDIEWYRKLQIDGDDNFYILLKVFCNLRKILSPRRESNPQTFWTPVRSVCDGQNRCETSWKCDDNDCSNK